MNKAVQGKSINYKGNSRFKGGLNSDRPLMVSELEDLINLIVDLSPYLKADGSVPMTGLLTLSGDPTQALNPVTKQLLDSTIASVIGGAPADLDTLEELANAINNDPNFSTTIGNEITNIKNYEFKVLYWANINTDTGTITKPSNTEIILNDFPQGYDAVAETIVNGKPTGEIAKTAGGDAITVSSFDASGNYILSDTPSPTPIALLYVLKVKAQYLSNLTFDNIIEAQNISASQAINVEFTPNGDLASTNVQDVIVELRDDTDTKLAALTTTTVAEGVNLYYTNARAISSTLTGYTSGAGTITAADTVLSAIQKLNGNISALPSYTFNSGLTNTANTVTNDLITGKSGGQTIIGGTDVTDALTYKSTTGNGTSTAAAHIFTGGNNGATEAMRILNAGNVIIGAAVPLFTEMFSIQKNHNAITQQIISNTTSGTAGRAAVSVTVGAGSVNFQAVSTAYTTNGIIEAACGVINSNATGGLNIGTTGATQLSGWTNDTRRFTVTSTGGFVIGATTAIASELFSVQQNQNALTRGLISNTTNGTAARTLWQVFTNGGLALSMVANSTSYTSSGMLEGNTSALLTTQTGGLNIGSSSAVQVSTWTNNLRRMMVLSSGEIILGDASAVIASEFVSIQNSANSDIAVRAKNGTNGTAASCSFLASNSGNNPVGIRAFGAAYTTSGLFIANGGSLFTGANMTGGLTVGTLGAYPLGFYTDNTLRATFLSTGEFIIGSVTSLIANEEVLIANNQVGPTSLFVSNTTSGTSARAQISALVNGTVGVTINANSAGFTSSGINIANAGAIVFNQSAGGNIGTTSATTFGLWTNNTLKWSITSGGVLTAEDAMHIAFGTGTGTKIGTATSQKIGFWNTTPIVQPTTGIAAATFVANTSGIADDTATFDGYTVGQVVKALRNVGLLT